MTPKNPDLSSLSKVSSSMGGGRILKHGVREVIKRVVEASKLSPVVMYIHGSQGTLWQRDDSDWDFAILADEALTWKQRLKLQQALALALGQEVIDLSDLRQCDTVFAAQVVSKGEAVYVGNDEKRQCYEVLVLAKYARLNEERALILNDIRRRGTVLSKGAV